MDIADVDCERTREASALKDAHDNQVARLLKQHEEKTCLMTEMHNSDLSSANSEHAQEISKLRKTHASEVNKLKEAHTNIVKTLEDRYEKDIIALKSKSKDKAMKIYKENVQKLKVKHETYALSQSERYNMLCNELSSQKMAHKDEIESLQKALISLKEKSSKEISDMVEEQEVSTRRFKDSLAEVKLQHQTSISEIREKAANDIVNLESHLQKQKDDSEEAYNTIVEEMEQLQERHDKLQGKFS